MKTLKTIIIALVAISLFGFISCKEKADDVKETVQEKLIGLMSADIDGTEWNADLPKGRIEGELTIITGVGVIGENEKAIILTLKGNSEGNYPINYDPLDTVSNSLNGATFNPEYQTPTAANTYTAFDGEITVDSKAERMTGTFNFTCANFGAASSGGTVDTIQITGGTFSNITYNE